LAGATSFVSLLFGMVCVLDWRTVKMPRPRLIGFLSLWVTLLSVVAAVEFLEWARLAVK
jgi:hypothetical protein